MSIRLITADERMAAANLRTTMLVAGVYGVGKTSLAYTLDPDTTLFLDFEAGTKSIETWGGDIIPIRSWDDAINVACYIGGPDPAVMLQTEPYSQAHYDHVHGLYGYPDGTEQPINLEKYRNIIFDSTSDLIAAKMKHAQSRNMVISPKLKELVIDTRGMYGDIGRDGMAFIRHLQHCDKNIIWICRLEQIVDEFKREVWQLQLDGQKVGREIPGVVDQVVTMAFFDWNPAAGGWVFNPKDGSQRAFVCRRANQWGLPAKERTQGNLDVIEPPDLGALLAKINQVNGARTS